jgi:hypothetical protein
MSNSNLAYFHAVFRGIHGVTISQDYEHVRPLHPDASDIKSLACYGHIAPCQEPEIHATYDASP